MECRRFLTEKYTVIRSAAEGDERIYQGGPDGINWGSLSKEAQAANLRYCYYTDKKGYKTFLIYKEIQMWSGGKSCIWGRAS
jgi:hypothetical protein